MKTPSIEKMKGESYSSKGEERGTTKSREKIYLEVFDMHMPTII